MHPESVVKPTAELSDEQDWEARVSLWMDGEGDIRPEDLDTPYGRQVWDTYHLIGDVLRSPGLAIQPSDMFYARLSRAIDEEPVVLAPQALRRPWLKRAGLSGLAVAAAVAMVVWVAVPYLAEHPTAADSAPVMARVDDPAMWQDYVDAHRDVAGLGGLRHASFQGGSRP